MAITVFTSNGTERKHVDGETFSVSGTGILSVENAATDIIAVYAAGSWSCAEIAAS